MVVSQWRVESPKERLIQSYCKKKTAFFFHNKLIKWRPPVIPLLLCRRPIQTFNSNILESLRELFHGPKSSRTLVRHALDSTRDWYSTRYGLLNGLPIQVDKHKFYFEHKHKSIFSYDCTLSIGRYLCFQRIISSHSLPALLSCIKYVILKPDVYHGFCRPTRSCHRK